MNDGGVILPPSFVSAAIADRAVSKIRLPPCATFNVLYRDIDRRDRVLMLDGQVSQAAVRATVRAAVPTTGFPSNHLRGMSVI